jgi:hypothetical protein
LRPEFAAFRCWHAESITTGVFQAFWAVNILPEYIYSPFVYADIKAKTPDTPLKQQITANFRVQSRLASHDDGCDDDGITSRLHHTSSHAVDQAHFELAAFDICEAEFLYRFGGDVAVECNVGHKLGHIDFADLFFFQADISCQRTE